MDGTADQSIGNTAWEQGVPFDIKVISHISTQELTQVINISQELASSSRN
jgi:hypothetical protein